MTEKKPVSKEFSADWLMRGALTRLGDTVDRFTGRRWSPSSSLATSELIERIKKLLDAEAKEVEGKGTVVPHDIKLRIQWDKFSTDAEDALANLQAELLIATVDHINDSLYYTYAPVTLEVKPDYFIQGVKFFVSFDQFGDQEGEVELNVTVPSINIQQALASAETADPVGETYIARYKIKGQEKERKLCIAVGGRISVGRTGSNELVLDDISVSKVHASLGVGAGAVLSVADTGSTNGTFINDERIAYGKAMRLVEDDRVKFGTVEVTFEHTPRPPEDAVEPAKNDTVEIDGFEFTRRERSEPAEKLAPQDIEKTAEIEEQTNTAAERTEGESENNN
jgi:pSer/pThr/pTyr-binding forkhead associated (FHA) protein